MNIKFRLWEVRGNKVETLARYMVVSWTSAHSVILELDASCGGGNKLSPSESESLAVYLSTSKRRLCCQTQICC